MKLNQICLLHQTFIIAKMLLGISTNYYNLVFVCCHIIQTGSLFIMLIPDNYRFNSGFYGFKCDISHYSIIIFLQSKINEIIDGGTWLGEQP